jgi:hypothetical protein
MVLKLKITIPDLLLLIVFGWLGLLLLVMIIVVTIGVIDGPGIGTITKGAAAVLKWIVVVFMVLCSMNFGMAIGHMPFMIVGLILTKIAGNVEAGLFYIAIGAIVGALTGLILNSTTNSDFDKRIYPIAGGMAIGVAVSWTL